MHVLYYTVKVNNRGTIQSNYHRRDKSKQEAYWNTAPVCTSFSSQAISVLVLNTSCTHSTTYSFGFKMGPLLKIKPVYLTLLLYV